jgi:hypothetical protein
MWGQWFSVTFGGILLVLLVIASAFLGSPLLALLVAVVGLGALAALYVLRRAAARPAASTGSENPITNPRNPASGGAPVAGEGSEPPNRSLGG